MFLLRGQQRNVERARKQRAPRSPTLFPYLSLSSTRDTLLAAFSIPLARPARLGTSRACTYATDARENHACTRDNHTGTSQSFATAYIHGELAPWYPRTRGGILNALHTVTCHSRRCSPLPTPPPPNPPLCPTAGLPHQHALS